jgi:hypothetical protein
MGLIPLGILSSAGSQLSGTYELISSEILGSAQPSVTFSSLGNYSSTYKHLQIRYVARSTSGGADESIRFRLNGDSGSNYTLHQLLGTGSTVISTSSTSQTGTSVGIIAGGTAAANTFGLGIVDIIDPYSTTKNTTIRALTGLPNASNLISLRSGLHISTSAVSSIEITAASAANLATGSRFSLYGIRG